MLKNQLKKLFKRKNYSCKICQDTKYIPCPKCMGGGIYIPKYSPLENFYTNVDLHISCNKCNGERIIECPYCKKYDEDDSNTLQNEISEDYFLRKHK